MSFIILDRDGVINFDSEAYIKSPEECHAIPGSLDAIAMLNRHGYRVVVATNQSGIARGYYDLATLDTIHEKLLAELNAVGGHIEAFYFCPHHPDDRCYCRKPKPGLLEKIAEEYAINLAETFFIGDSLSDVEAAFAARAKPMLVLTGNGQKATALHPELIQVPQFPNLAHAVQHILSSKTT